MNVRLGNSSSTVLDIKDCFCRTRAQISWEYVFRAWYTCVLSKALECDASLIDDNSRRLIVAEGGFVYVPRTSFPDTTLSEDVEDFGVCPGHRSRHRPSDRAMSRGRHALTAVRPLQLDIKWSSPLLSMAMNSFPHTLFVFTATCQGTSLRFQSIAKNALLFGTHRWQSIVP